MKGCIVKEFGKFRQRKTRDVASGALAAALLIAMIWFICVNTETVRVTIWWWRADAPLWVVLTFAAIVGAAVMAIAVTWRRHRRRPS